MQKSARASVPKLVEFTDRDRAELVDWRNATASLGIVTSQFEALPNLAEISTVERGHRRAAFAVLRTSKGVEVEDVRGARPSRLIETSSMKAALEEVREAVLTARGRSALEALRNWSWKVSNAA